MIIYILYNLDITMIEALHGGKGMVTNSRLIWGEMKKV